MTHPRILAGFCCCFLFIGCTDIKTENDTTPPTLSAWLFNVESEAVIFRSTDSSMDVTNNCPTSKGYFTELDNTTLEVGVLASDKGGIDKMTIEISPVRKADIRNVVAVNNPDHIPTVTQTSPLDVTITAEFSNRLTGQMIKFEVMGIDTLMFIDAEAVDLLLHRSAFIEPGVSVFPARVLRDDLCPN